MTNLKNSKRFTTNGLEMAVHKFNRGIEKTVERICMKDSLAPIPSVELGETSREGSEPAEEPINENIQTTLLR